MIVNYDSRVVLLDGKLLVKTTIGRVAIYNCGAHTRLTSIPTMSWLSTMKLFAFVCVRPPLIRYIINSAGLALT